MKLVSSEAEQRDDVTPTPSGSEEPSFPPDTAKYMTWSAIKFINSPTSRMLDLTCTILFGALVMCFVLSKFLSIDVSVRGPAEINVDGGVRELVSPIDGLVTKVFKKNGDPVSEQDLIARIQLDDQGALEMENLDKAITKMITKVEATSHPESLDIVMPALIKSTKILDPQLLQAVATIEHTIHDFQIARAQVLVLKGNRDKIHSATDKVASEVFYSNKRIDFLNNRLKQMKASKNRELLASYIDSTEEEIGRLKNQVTSTQLRAKAVMDQGYADLVRSLRIASGAVNDFKQHHEIRSPVAGVIGKLIDGDNIHVTTNRSIATIIPSHAKFIARIKMQSKDIVRLKKGQPVFFKVEAYPFQRYGLFTGEVIDFDQLKESPLAGQANSDDTFILNASISAPDKLDENLKKQIKFIYGMKAEATVVMERKSINNIIMDKFFNLKDL